MAGQLEAGPQVVEGLQDPQALLRADGELFLRGRRQIGIGSRLGAAHPAAQLIELGQTEHVGPVDDHGVGGGNIEPGLDDRRGQQHVVFAVVEGAHYVFQGRRGHLAVPDNELHLRHLLRQEIR